MTSEGLTLAGNHTAVFPITTEHKSEAEEPRARLTETERKYRVQVIVTDPEGQEVLNLTKLAFEDELQHSGNPTLDIAEALQLLVDVAGEWST
jgi:hypothetical protein